MRVLFLTRCLDYGGAERQLAVLARGLREKGHEVSVAVFYSDGPLESVLNEAGVPVICLEKTGRWDLFGFLPRLIRLLRQERPDILHSYLSVPNLLTLFIKPIVPRMRMVWGLRASNMDLGRYDWLTRLSYLFERWFSRFADLIIANSYAGRSYAIGRGFPEDKIIAILNGIDTTLFRPDPEAGRRVRSEWGISDDEQLIGLVARLDPIKDHPTFLKAAALLAKERRDVRFVCAGDGPRRYRCELHALSHALGLNGKLIWAGAQDDMPAIYNSLDIASSSSYGEGFPNVIAEAMACGVPCVVTDVGDSAKIVGDLGLVVQPNDPQGLAQALSYALTEHPFADPHRLRQRIITFLSLPSMIEATETVLCDLHSGILTRISQIDHNFTHLGR